MFFSVITGGFQILTTPKIKIVTEILISEQVFVCFQMLYPELVKNSSTVKCRYNLHFSFSPTRTNFFKSFWSYNKGILPEATISIYCTLKRIRVLNFFLCNVKKVNNQPYLHIHVMHVAAFYPQDSH